MEMLHRIRPMSPELDAYLRSIIKKIVIKKKKDILRIGKVPKFIGYIKTGFIRGYIWKKNREVTTFIVKEGDIFISPKAFLLQIASEEGIASIEDCEIWGITFAQLEEAYRRFPEFNYHGRIITSQYYIRCMDQLTFLTRYTAIEKLKILMETDPALVSRTPSNVLASYLNMNESTFSKAKKRLMQKSKKKKLG